jgi:hypothetical protein
MVDLVWRLRGWSIETQDRTGEIKAASEGTQKSLFSCFSRQKKLLKITW